ncbi:MAG: hypothetical protein D6714_07880 [Bacteroidetes bacterium]|nr:MAG: hypothetical protein D6714_07880 [Bacteroidota bacterium]
MFKIWIALIVFSGIMVVEHSQDLMPSKKQNTGEKVMVAFQGEQPRAVLLGQINTQTPPDPDCDPADHSFSRNIFPTLQKKCVLCHNARFAQGEVVLDTYEAILEQVKTGALLGSVQKKEGVAPMPPEGMGLSISECEINQIAKWIEAGAKKD